MNLDHNEKDDETTERANRYLEHLQALKLRTDKILTLCDRGELDLLLKKS